MPLATYQRICLLRGCRWQALDPVERARYEARAEEFKAGESGRAGLRAHRRVGCSADSPDPSN
eukprot:4990856-Lingulodinium_polyedra.AAC.1